jgi:hypothetical protein
MRFGRHWKLAFLVLVAVAAGAFLFLRGGEEEGPELTHAALVREANAICAELAERNLDLPPPPVPYGTLAEPFFQDFNDGVDRARDRLDALNAPAPDEAGVDELVRTLGLVSTRAQEAAGASSVDQSSEVEALIAEIGQLAEQAAEAERRLGICPEGTSFRVSVGTVIRRTGENPLTETGTLG